MKIFSRKEKTLCGNTLIIKIVITVMLNKPFYYLTITSDLLH